MSVRITIDHRVLDGATAARALKRVEEILQGPIADELRGQATAFGRDPDSLEISLFVMSIPEQATLAEMESKGVKRVILTVYGQTREEVLPKLDLLAKTS